MADNKMKDYPTLRKMGIESPKQIDKYYVTSINYVDVLRIVYDRPEGSFLPSTRSYKFPRVPDQQAGNTDQQKRPGVLRLHPMLREAQAELDLILAAKASKENIAAEILSEIELLEEDIAIRAECIKSLVSKIPAID